MTTQSEIYTTDTNKINVVWRNDTNKELTFGESYSLEKKINGEWKKVYADKEVAFTSIGLPVLAHSNRKHEYNIRVYTDKLEVGSYRITTTFLDVHNPGNYDAYLLYAQFLVK